MLEKLSVLIPAPRRHGLRYHGVLAPHAAWRALIVPRPGEEAGRETSPATGASGGGGPAAASSSSPRLDWAALLRRVFALDVLHCPRCGGRRRIVAVHTRPATLHPPLARLGLDLSPGGPGPSRSPPPPAA